MATPDWQAEMAEALKRFTGPGVSSMETLKALPGLEFLQRIVDGRLPRPPICDTLNFQLLEVERGRAVFQARRSPSTATRSARSIGGWPATLLDSCMACAVHTTLPAGQGYTTVEFKLNLVRPILGNTGPLRAEGKLINAGRTLATSEGRLFGPDGKLYAHGTETCLLFPL